MTKKEPRRRAKKTTRQRRPEEVRKRILEAALRSFAVHGFAGAVMQDIAKDSGAGLSLLVYHFKSKKNLWRAAVGAAAERFHSQIESMAAASDVTATQRLRLLMATLVRLSAEFPEFTRIVAMEAYQKSDRLLWLVRFGQHSFESLMTLIAQAQREGGVRSDLEPERLRYAVLGISSIPSLAAEFRQLTGRDPTSAAEIEASIEFIDKLVFATTASDLKRVDATA
jgi:TetR/AcrR family transcriptional regulator